MLFPIIVLVVGIGGAVLIDRIAEDDEKRKAALFWPWLVLMGTVFLVEGILAHVSGKPLIHLRMGAPFEGKQLIGASLIMIVPGIVIMIQNYFRKH